MARRFAVHNCNRLGPADRLSKRQRRKIRLADQGFLEQSVIAAFGNLDRAEGPQMVRDILRVEQPVSAGLEPCDQMDERDLGCIARAVEHAFAEEGAPKRHAIEPADETITLINLDRMTMASIEQRAIDAADASIDPGAGAILFRLGATLDHRIEVAIDMNGAGS